MVEKAFKKLDRTGRGSVTLADMRSLYDASFHPDVKSGKRSADDVLLEYLHGFEGASERRCPPPPLTLPRWQSRRRCDVGRI
jgi:calcyphosin